ATECRSYAASPPWRRRSIRSALFCAQKENEQEGRRRPKVAAPGCSHSPGEDGSQSGGPFPLQSARRHSSAGPDAEFARRAEVAATAGRVRGKAVARV